MKRPSRLARLAAGRMGKHVHTLHMWTQIVGKIRLGFTPLLNHWWNVALYVNTARIDDLNDPYQGGAFEIQFNFVHHRLEIRTSDGVDASWRSRPNRSAAFIENCFRRCRGASTPNQHEPAEFQTRLR